MSNSRMPTARAVKHDPSKLETPIGVPLQCVALLNPVNEGKIIGGATKLIVDGHNVKMGTMDKEGFEFQKVYDPEAKEQEIFDKEIKPLVTAVVDGYNSSVLAWGPSGTGRNTSFVGSPQLNRDGYMFKSVELLLSLLKKKMRENSSKPKPKNSNDKFKYIEGVDGFTVHVQYVEVVSDQLVDLFHETGIQETPPTLQFTKDGVRIPELQKVQVNHGADFLSTLTRAQGKRTSVVTEFGPQQDKSTAILTILVEQSLPSQQEKLMSKMNFVMLPATNNLRYDAQILRRREGMINTELMGIASLINSISKTDRVEFTVYSHCKSTVLLDEIVGGNSITLCMVHLNTALSEEDLEVVRATIDHTRMLGKVVNYPVKNDDRMRGCMGRLRSQMMQMKEELRIAQRSQMGGHNSESNDKILELRSALTESVGERQRLSAITEKLKVRYEGFREKYSKLVEDKTSLQASLIKSEEERLKVSKMLIDLQMENVEINEQRVTEKYELESKLQSSEITKIEEEGEKERQAQKNAKLAAQIHTLIDEKKELTLEYIALKQNYDHSIQDMEAMKAKQNAIGVELLSLVNAKNVLAAENEQMRKRHTQTMEQNEDLAAFKANSEAQNKSLHDKMSSLKSNNEELKLEMLRKDILLKKKESSATEQYRELAESKQGEQQKAKKMEGQLKIANRNVIELRNTIRDLEKEKSTWLREYDDVQTKMSEMALGYREKLLAYMAELTAIQSKGTLDTHTADEMYREVMTTTAQRETELLSELEESRQICARVNDKNRSLAQQFRRLRHYLEETGVDTSTVTLDDEELVKLTTTSKEDVVSDKSAVFRLRKELQTLQDQVDRANATNINVSQTLNKLRTEHRALEAEHQNCQIVAPELKQIKQLMEMQMGAAGNTGVNDIGQLRKEVHTCHLEIAKLEKELAIKDTKMTVVIRELQAKKDIQLINDASGTKGHNHALAVLLKKIEAKDLQIMELERRLGLRHGEAAKLAGATQVEKDQHASMTDQIARLEAENSRLRGVKGQVDDATRDAWIIKEESFVSKIKSLEKSLKDTKGQLNRAVGGKNQSSAEAEAIIKYKKQMQEFRETTQRRLEEEKAKLQIMLQKAEEELKNFQVYMKQTAGKYNGEILRLKKEIVYLRGVTK